MIWAGVAVIALALGTGWAALGPLRDRLGTWGYHLLAVPTGLTAWVLVPLISTLLGTGYEWWVVAAGHATFIAALAVAGWWLGRDANDTSGSSVPPFSWLLAGAAILAAAAFFAYRGLTAISFDSLFHYEISGMWLLDGGQLDALIMSARNVLVPSLHAAARFFGGEWSFVYQPVLSVLGVVVLLAVLYTDAFKDSSRAWRIGLSLALTLALATTPNWLRHSHYAHSNLPSAVYLLYAVAALGMASGFAGRRRAEWAWALPAGIVTAGFVLLRPDGLAYLFVPLGLAIVLYLSEKLDVRTYAIFCLSALMPLLAVYAVGFFELGLWESDKLSGSRAAAVLAVSFAACIAGWLLPRAGRFGDWIAGRYNALRLAAAVNIVAAGSVLYLYREGAVPAIQNMLGNLMTEGAWGFFWYAAAAVVALSLVFAGLTRRSAWAWYLLYVLGQFFAIALVVHGLTHVGRLSVFDSFNRVALHIVPIVVWYAGAFLGTLAIGTKGTGESAE
jgi:hypothetical protein